MNPREQLRLPRPSARARAWQWLQPRLTFLGSSLVSLIVLTVFAYNSTRQQLSPPETTAFALLTALLGIFATGSAARTGRVDPDKARSAVRRLLTLGRAQGDNLMRLQLALGTENAHLIEREARTVAEGLRIGGYEIKDAIADWQDVHPEALREVLEREGLNTP